MTILYSKLDSFEMCIQICQVFPMVFENYRADFRELIPEEDGATENSQGSALKAFFYSKYSCALPFQKFYN